MSTPISNGTEPISIELFVDTMTHSGVQLWLIISGIINIALMICVISCIWLCIVRNRKNGHSKGHESQGTTSQWYIGVPLQGEAGDQQTQNIESVTECVLDVKKFNSMNGVQS